MTRDLCAQIGFVNSRVKPGEVVKAAVLNEVMGMICGLNSVFLYPCAAPVRKHTILQVLKSPGFPGLFKEMAERQGFEPWVRKRTTVFETAPFDHSGTSPHLDPYGLRRAETSLKLMGAQAGQCAFGRVFHHAIYRVSLGDLGERHKALTCAVFGVYCRLPNLESDFRDFAMRSPRRL